jgi:hypothetical protein
MDENFLKRTCLTPRSQEAFRMSGVLPLEIVYDKFEHYLNYLTKHPEEIAQIKLKKALQSHSDKWQVLKRDVKKIIKLEGDGKWDAESSIMQSRLQAWTFSAMPKTSAMIEVEKEKIAKIRQAVTGAEKMLEQEFTLQAIRQRKIENVGT